MTRLRGGRGIVAYGHSEFGESKATIEARFNWSKPPDNSINVPANVWLAFTTYCYTSWIDFEDITVEISEDDGVTYNLAYASLAFVAPYDGVNSKIRRPDGHSIKFWIQKTTLWALNETLKIRFTGTDEFGQLATKVDPEYWP